MDKLSELTGSLDACPDVGLYTTNTIPVRSNLSQYPGKLYLVPISREDTLDVVYGTRWHGDRLISVDLCKTTDSARIINNSDTSISRYINKEEFKMSIKGYKVFNPNWTCRGFQYEVGKTYKHEGDIQLCGAGFHFCQKLSECFNYYDFNSNNKVAEVEAIGRVQTEDGKSVTDEIIIIRELTWYEALNMCNIGSDNTGIHNSGNHNSGNWNSGDCNSGNENSGDENSGGWNSGNHNSGDWNSGDCNSGNRNSGYRNSGNWNSGNWNSGNWNSASYSTGFFNSVSQPLYAFNKPISIGRDAFISCKGCRVLMRNYANSWWIYSDDMTDTEKAQHPEHETAGGYFKVVNFKTACKMMWEKLDDEDKQAVKEIPNFDAEVFKEITGIDAEEG